MILTRKRTREKQLELRSEVIEVLEETDRNNITRPSVVSSSSEPREAERNGHGTTKCTIPPEPEESTSKTLTEGSIFDHIRKKSKNFPVINKLKTIDSELLLWTKEHSSESGAEFGTAYSEILNELNSDKVLTDTITISDLEPRKVERDSCVSKESTKVRHNLFSGSSPGTYGLMNLPPRVSSPSGDLSSIEMLSFDISMLKNNGQSADPVSSMKSSRKQQCSSREFKRQHYSPTVSRRQLCSSETANETTEADSFLGFKSVFSFL